MRIFVTGATGALGRHLVPGLVAAGHEVTATTRTPGKVAQLREAGAEPVVLDGRDREAVIAAVQAAAPEVIGHQMTALAGVRSLRKPDKAFAATNELRTWGTDNLLAAAERAGTRRVIAHGRGRVKAAAALHRYGMTGSVGDAEDVVQDAFLGLTRARQAGTTMTDLKAYLTTAVTRLGINYLSSARGAEGDVRG
jgi:UDP-glucose 4-epimerase